MFMDNSYKHDDILTTDSAVLHTFRCPRPLGPEEDGLLVSPGKAYKPLTDHLFSG